MEANPSYWGGEPTIDRVDVPGVHQPRRHGRRAGAGRDRRRPQHPLGQRRAPRAEPGHRGRAGPAGRLRRAGHERRRRWHRRRPPGAAGRQGPPGHRPRHRQGDDRRPGRTTAWRAGATPMSPVPGPDLGPRDRRAVRVRPRPGEPDPRRRRLRGHRRQRRPGDARRRRRADASAGRCAPSPTSPSRSTSSSAVGWPRSASRPRSRPTTTPSSARSSAGASGTCSSGAGPRSSTPTRMLSYFTCDQVSTDPEDPLDYYNDANWCNEDYDALYEEQNQELDRERRVEIVHEMLTLFYDEAAYSCCTTPPTSRPTARTGSRVGCSSPPTSGRCSSPTPRRPTSTSSRSARRAAAEATTAAAATPG